MGLSEEVVIMKNFKYLILFALLYCGVLHAVPVGTEFTYQGELMQSGAVADGLYDFEFQLFDENENGVSVTSTVVMNDITVSRGLFTVLLDFGDAPFDGEAVFLEIRVRETADSNFTTLAPRQPITAAPYAIQAEFVGVDGVNSNSIVNNSIMSSDLAENAVGSSQIADNSVGSADIMQNAVGANEIDSNQVQERVTGVCLAGQSMGSINQDGSVNCQAVGADTDWNETVNTVWTDKNVAIGGSDATIGSGTFAVHGPFENTFGGMFVNVDGTGTQQPFYGYSTNSTFRAWTEFNEESDQWRVNINNGYRFFVTATGAVGINEPNPLATLHVDGSVRFEDLGISGTGTAPLRVDASGDVVAGPSTYTVSISPAAFTVEEDGDSFSKILGSGHAYIQTGFGALSAPVYLPDGATVTGVNIWYLDSSASDATFRLRRTPHNVVSNEDLAAFTPTGNTTGIQTASDTTINFSTITNTTHSYYFRVFSSSWTGVNMGIKAVTITYRL